MWKYRGWWISMWLYDASYELIDAALNGMELLDEKGPDDWRDGVAWGSDMCEGGESILKDIYGSYEEGCRELGIDPADGGRYGFARGAYADEYESTEDWDGEAAYWSDLGLVWSCLQDAERSTEETDAEYETVPLRALSGD